MPKQKTWSAPPIEPKSLVEAYQCSTANALMERFRLDADIASGGYMLLRIMLERVKHGVLAKELGVLPSNLSAMAAGRLPIPEPVLIKLCEMKLEQTQTHERGVT
jgi:hypothetical protein